MISETEFKDHLKEKIKQYELLANEGKQMTEIGFGFLVIGRSADKVAVAWNALHQVDFLVTFLEGLGFVSGRHDKKSGKGNL